MVAQEHKFSGRAMGRRHDVVNGYLHIGGSNSMDRYLQKVEF